MKHKKKIFLIGGDGFVGRHFQKLYSKNYLFRVYDKSDNVLNYQNLIKSINNFLPDYVINFASYSTIDSAKIFQKELYDLSIHGNNNILKALHEINFKGKYLYVSSGEVYGYSKTKKFSELSSLNPMNEYATSKVMAEALIKFKSQNSSYKTIIARPFNHFGPHQSVNFFIPQLLENIASQVKNNSSEILLNIRNNHSKRSYLSVEDVCSAYLTILTKSNSEEYSVYNVCSSDSSTIPQLFSPLLQELNIKYSFIQSNENSFENTLQGNNKKILQLGWSPKKSLVKTLKEMYKNFLEK